MPYFLSLSPQKQTPAHLPRSPTVVLPGLNRAPCLHLSLSPSWLPRDCRLALRWRRERITTAASIWGWVLLVSQSVELTTLTEYRVQIVTEYRDGQDTRMRLRVCLLSRVFCLSSGYRVYVCTHATAFYWWSVLLPHGTKMNLVVKKPGDSNILHPPDRKAYHYTADV